MSTWSVEDEAMEFGLWETEHVDYRVNYRHLYIDAPEGAVEFPMLADAEVALHYGPLSLNLGFGQYSRYKTEESRSNYLQFRLSSFYILRAGFFMPTYGLGTNDHTLQIKKGFGLGRGSERYTVENYFFINKTVQVFLSAASYNFNLSSNDTGSYELGTLADETQYFSRVSAFLSKKSEIGFSVQGTAPDMMGVIGVFGRWSPWETAYLLAEHNQNKERSREASYVRFGGFVYRGVDLYYERDSLINLGVENTSEYVGLDFAIRPRFNLSLKIALDSGAPNIYQFHGWL